MFGVQRVEVRKSGMRIKMYRFYYCLVYSYIILSEHELMQLKMVQFTLTQ